jgi:hypothetical protein
MKDVSRTRDEDRQRNAADCSRWLTMIREV